MIKYKDRKGIGRPRGWKMPEEVKAKISASKKGYRHSKETKAKISDGVKGRHETGAPIDVIMNTELAGCRRNNVNGYITIAIPNPDCGKPSYNQREHTFIMEKKLGRKLQEGEEVHHWGDKDNNNPMLLTVVANKKQHIMLDRVRRKLWKMLGKVDAR